MGRKSDRSRIVYNKMASDYDSSREGIYTHAHKAELIKRVAAEDGDRILDVACGNGYLLSELYKKADIQAFGIDISENMIASAKERYPNCTFAVSPSYPLPFDDGSLDIITVSCAFHHFEKPQSFADECKRALKPNGSIYLAEPYFPAAIRAIANAIVFPLARSGDVKVYSPKKLCSFFRKAGFVRIQTDIINSVLFLSAQTT